MTSSSRTGTTEIMCRDNSPRVLNIIIACAFGHCSVDVCRVCSCVCFEMSPRACVCVNLLTFSLATVEDRVVPQFVSGSPTTISFRCVRIRRVCFCRAAAAAAVAGLVTIWSSIKIAFIVARQSCCDKICTYVRVASQQCFDMAWHQTIMQTMETTE